MIRGEIDKEKTPSEQELDTMLREIFPFGEGISPENNIITHKKQFVYINLRLRKDLADSMNKMLESRIGMSKTSWIMEAIQEKIRRGS